MGHVVLLGDSILDNAVYARPEPSVTEHLSGVLARRASGAHWRTTLCAVDGSLTAEVERQILSVPSDATHMVLSTGGNDALMERVLLRARSASVAEALVTFSEPLRVFEDSYQRVLMKTRALGLPTAVCTIYNGHLPPEEAGPARVALMLFNDIIQRSAHAAGASILELRSICTEPADYANPIEPSGTGGYKIALAIARAIGAV